MLIRPPAVQETSATVQELSLKDIQSLPAYRVWGRARPHDIRPPRAPYPGREVPYAFADRHKPAVPDANDGRLNAVRKAARGAIIAGLVVACLGIFTNSGLWIAASPDAASWRVGVAAFVVLLSMELTRAQRERRRALDQLADYERDFWEWDRAEVDKDRQRYAEDVRTERLYQIDDWYWAYVKFFKARLEQVETTLLATFAEYVASVDFLGKANPAYHIDAFSAHLPTLPIPDLGVMEHSRDLQVRAMVRAMRTRMGGPLGVPGIAYPQHPLRNPSKYSEIVNEPTLLMLDKLTASLKMLP